MIQFLELVPLGQSGNMIFADQEKKNIVRMLSMIGAGRVDGVRGSSPIKFNRIDKKGRFILDGECRKPAWCLGQVWGKATDG